MEVFCLGLLKRKMSQNWAEKWGKFITLRGIELRIEHCFSSPIVQRAWTYFLSGENLRLYRRILKKLSILKTKD
ncbi:hypothetical protein AVEN_126285-1 [Araneus ventricosus]|uniref:AXH domain-containing protein n=1 Tax=Araneus ventricosus TaxID=182803 RepID=A0A4Y2GRV0_ARAVE|nr:hypothetical protein AVEN_126285-1 [Araneus ventricosus]